MNHNEETFRDFTKQFGRPMTAEDFDKEFEAAGLPGPRSDYWHVPVFMMSLIAEQFKDSTNAHGMNFNYFCGLNRSPSANAVIGVQDETFCIAIYDGLLLSIQEVAYWLFNDPEFSTDIGNIALIRHPYLDKLSKLSAQQLLVGHIWKQRVASGRTPFLENYFRIDCQTRFEAAQLLVTEMIFFVVLHELAHMKLGHILYNEKTFGAAHIMEVNVAAGDDASEASIVSRVFEYDADLNAMRDLLSVNFFKPNFLDSESASRIRILAPFLVLTLFLNEWRSSLEDFRGPESHPEPLKRMYALKRWLDALSDFRDLRDRGCLESLVSDLAKASRSIGTIEVAIPVILAEKGLMADQVWGEDFEKEYALAAVHTNRAIDWGFGIRG